MINHFNRILLVIFFILNTPDGNSQPIMNDPYQPRTPVKQQMMMLKFGEVKPAGWLKTQMQKDLDGFVGHLAELVPDLMADCIYGRDRLTAQVKSKNVGNIGLEADPQYLWWNSETQSNWRDGYLRNAILLDSPKQLSNAKEYIRYILATQDSNGYLGIYAPDLRYNFSDENGELWAKTTVLRGLLGWYEYSGDTAVLAAVEHAVAEVMAAYPAGKSSPFRSAKPFAGGLTHGLTFTDVLDRLYQLTGNTEYLDYAFFLYMDFSENTLNEDGQYDKIMDSTYRLKEHGVHTYEQLRPLTVAWYASGNPGLKNALDAYLLKIAGCTTPSGGPVGDEWVGGRKADATLTGYEYCSIHELMDGYCSLLQKSGDPEYADLVENIFFNAAQGARHPRTSCIAYCKTDNSLAMTGPRNLEPDPEGHQTRFKYSPAHQDVAVCCVPNAGRIAPYYIKSMWMKDREGLVATLFGPNELKTTINGKEVKISEETDYPLGYTIRFRVETHDPNTFSLKIRKPGWLKKFTVNQAYSDSAGYICIHRVWNGVHEIELELKPGIVVKKDQNQEYYYTYGPLVFALPIAGQETVSRFYTVDGLADITCAPSALVNYRYTPAGKPKISFPRQPGLKPGWQSIALETNLINEQTGIPVQVILWPLGSTVLRQLTFRAAEQHPSSGTIRRFENFQSAYVESRHIDVWLPDGYDPGRKYAVLYMHDGQMLFDSANTWNQQEWAVEAVAGKLLAENRIRRCIVVGIWNNTPIRHTEYFPQKALDYLTEEQKNDLLHYTTGDEKRPMFPHKPLSDNYLKFLVTEVKPLIDRNFPTLPDRKNTFVAGSSMGGLISMYAVCEYPEIFGGAACLSTHWTVMYTAVNNPVPAAFVAYLNDHLPSPKSHKFYFDYGTETLDALYKPFQLQVDEVMKKKGYTEKSWITREFPGENHSEEAWRKRLDVSLIFLLKK